MRVFAWEVVKALALIAWRVVVDIGSGVRRGLIAVAVVIVLGVLGVQTLDVVGVLDEGFSTIGTLLERMADELSNLTGAVEAGVSELEAIENDLQ